MVAAPIVSIESFIIFLVISLLLSICLGGVVKKGNNVGLGWVHTYARYATCGLDFLFWLWVVNVKGKPTLGEMFLVEQADRKVLA